MNVFTFTGNLGQDCETRNAPSGDPIVSFSVAVKSGYGERAQTVWARCSMFGKRGEAVAPYLLKGQQVAISGELSLNEWQNRDGQTKTSLEVRVNDLTLIGKRDDSGVQDRNYAPRSQSTQPTQQRPAAPATSLDDIDDSIPF